MSTIDFSVALPLFVAVAQSICDANDAGNTVAAKPKLSVQLGKRFAKIVKTSYGTNRSVYCFVEIATGRIFKAASWKAPYLGSSRGSIYTEDNGASSVTAYGAVYA